MAKQKLSEKAQARKVKYNAQFTRDNYQRVLLNFSTRYDTEVLDKIQSVPNKTDYIRQLILADIAKEKD